MNKTAREILDSLPRKRPLSINDQIAALPPVYGQAAVCGIDAGHDGLALAILFKGSTYLWSGSIGDLDKASVWLHKIQDETRFRQVLTVRENMGHWRRGAAMNAAGKAIAQMIGRTFPRFCRHCKVHPRTWQAALGINGTEQNSYLKCYEHKVYPANEHEADAANIAYFADKIRKIVFGTY